jgi:hypothetical protein
VVDFESQLSYETGGPITKYPMIIPFNPMIPWYSTIFALDSHYIPIILTMKSHTKSLFWLLYSQLNIPIQFPVMVDFRWYIWYTHSYLFFTVIKPELPNLWDPRHQWSIAGVPGDPPLRLRRVRLRRRSHREPAGAAAPMACGNSKIEKKGGIPLKYWMNCFSIFFWGYYVYSDIYIYTYTYIYI